MSSDRLARTARTAITDYLRVAFPPALAAAREEWVVGVDDLKDPVRYDPYETQNLDQLPVIAVNLSRSARFSRSSVEPGAANEYQARHTVRVYGWVKAVDENPTQEARDDYAAVLAATLLDSPSLRSSGVFRVEEGTVEISYSDVVKVKGDRWIAGCSVSFDLTHVWSLRRVPLGTASAVRVEATVIPTHPALRDPRGP